jgi:RsiW-degrading membrane proteinase PrsW (M82 family)
MHFLETVPTVVGTAAVAPALLVLWLVIAADERPAPPLMVWAAFLLGAASISLLGIARAPFALFIAAAGDPWPALTLHSIFAIAAPEEIVKVSVIVLVAAWRKPLADPMDAVIYGAAAGLGFAAYENLVYLARYPEMWQSLALIRSILTVPFHGALGIIAGAYLAISRAGLALGAHRRERSWARVRLALSIILVPIMLHASFDLPLLALQMHPEFDGSGSVVLEAAAMLIGFGTIAFAARLVWRVGAHHAPRTELARVRLRHLRGMWALLVGGGGAGFAGFAFVLSSLRRWWIVTDAHATASFAPAGIASIAIGTVLLVMTAAVYVQGRNRLLASGGG